MPNEKVTDIAKEYGVSAYRIKTAIQRGELDGQKDGAFWVVDRDSFVKWAIKSAGKTKNTAKPARALAKRRSLICPSCGSEDIKSASTVIAQGTFTGSEQHSGIGVGSGGSVAVGVGKSNISYQSEAARNVKGVDEKNCAEEFGGSVGAFIGIVLGILIGASAGSFWVGLIVTFTCTGIGMAMGKNSNLGQSEEERIRREADQFSRSFVCQICSHQFYK